MIFFLYSHFKSTILKNQFTPVEFLPWYNRDYWWQLLAETEMMQSIPHWLESQGSVSSAQGNWWHSTLKHSFALKVTKSNSKLTSWSHEEESSSKHCLKQWAWENPYSDSESHRGEMHEACKELGLRPLVSAALSTEGLPGAFLWTSHCCPVSGRSHSLGSTWLSPTVL